MDKLTASEAIYAFVGWITTREERVCASSKDDCAVWAELIKEFTERNELSAPREKWTDNLVSMVKERP